MSAVCYNLSMENHEFQQQEINVEVTVENPLVSETETSFSEEAVIAAVDELGWEIESLLKENEAFKEAFVSGEYDTFLSEEASARLATLILRKGYFNLHGKSPETYFVNSGRHLLRSDNELLQFFKKLDDRRREAGQYKKVLILSEGMDTGSSVDSILKHLDLFESLRWEHSDICALERPKLIGNINFDFNLIHELKKNKGYVYVSVKDHGAKSENIKNAIEAGDVEKLIPRELKFITYETNREPVDSIGPSVHKVFIPINHTETPSKWMQTREDNDPISLALGVKKRIINAPLDLDALKEGDKKVNRAKGYGWSRLVEGSVIVGAHPKKIEEILEKPNFEKEDVYEYNHKTGLDHDVKEEVALEIENILKTSSPDDVHRVGEKLTPEKLREIAKYKKIARDRCNYWADKLFKVTTGKENG